ncbi:hypothetical protein ACFSSA_02105 [Luteolibacter algae]|uniref:Uncharacterized protein n=1 Tax=Luteolibacter algae TaxID=454151 RepID=A0ABW5D347_9BACT
MIVPKYWAEGSVRHRKKGKQVTIRRFGWSDESEQAAQCMADERAEEALQRVLSGESSTRRREPRIPYNGAEGVPIREEIVDTRGEAVLTRNSYGALCLNTPNVFFIDIDFADIKPFAGMTFWLYLVGFAIAVAMVSTGYIVGASVVLAFVGALIFPPVLGRMLKRSFLKARGGPEQYATRRIDAFLENHKDWSLRVYRTPAGFRLLVTHRPFMPSEPEVSSAFEELGSDMTYRIMCLRQHCFRARVSPKPWRIGMDDHIRPRPGVWPVKPEYLPLRAEWIRRYSEAEKLFAACLYVGSKGQSFIHSEVRPVVEWHDELCKSTSDLPIA